MDDETRGTGGFERHIREAIDLNQHRAPLYAEASGGLSLVVSRGLIRRERALLPLARWLDRRAERYHRAGIPLMDELFVPMSGALPSLARTDPSTPTLPRPAGRELARRVRAASRKGP